MRQIAQVVVRNGNIQVRVGRFALERVDVVAVQQRRQVVADVVRVARVRRQLDAGVVVVVAVVVVDAGQPVAALGEIARLGWPVARLSDFEHQSHADFDVERQVTVEQPIACGNGVRFGFYAPILLTTLYFFTARLSIETYSSRKD